MWPRNKVPSQFHWPGRKERRGATGWNWLFRTSSGEIWKGAVETRELARERMRQLEEAVGAVVFVRVLSELNVSPPGLGQLLRN